MTNPELPQGDSMKKHPLLSELVRAADGNAANANVGFGHLAAIFDAVVALVGSKPSAACALSKAGSYWAESLADEMLRFQESIGCTGGDE
jgi:hypothetical protein